MIYKSQYRSCLSDMSTVYGTSQKELNFLLLMLLSIKHCHRHNGPKAFYLKYFDSFNNFISRQTLQEALISWLNLSFVLFVKGRRKHTIYTYIQYIHCTYNKSMERIGEVHVPNLTKNVKKIDKTNNL